MPRVSVIIPVFNSARTIAQAIDSVLSQSFRDFEVIAVDDDSADNSLEVIARYGDRVRVLKQKNHGPSAARNVGIRNSSGELTAFLDGDDWWKPAMLSTMIPVIESDPACVLAYCDLCVADSEGVPLDTSLAKARSTAPPTVQDMLHALWPIMPSGVVLRRSALDAVGGFPEKLRAFEDVYLWLLMREQGSFAHVPQSLAVWRFALFPDPLKAARGQDEAGRIFRAMVRERYGIDPVKHVRARWQAPRSILGFIGLNALSHGDKLVARRAFRRALELDPYRMRNYLRWFRTMLPIGLARALSGGSGRAV